MIRSWWIWIVVTGLVMMPALFAGCGSPDPAPVHRDSSGYGSSGDTGVSSKKTGTFKPYKISGKTYYPLATAGGFSQKGLASWYGKQFHGRKTANGETYNMYAMTAAHKTLPMNTWVEVTNLDNQRKITVRVNDRGPFVRKRIIDLSYTAAKKLGVVGPGTASVHVRALGKKTAGATAAYTPVNYTQGNFTVQVGAFAVESNARRLAHRLSTRYDHAHVMRYEDHRGTFFRVRVGRFSHLKKAYEFSRELMAAGADDAFVVGE